MGEKSDPFYSKMMDDFKTGRRLSMNFPGTSRLSEAFPLPYESPLFKRSLDDSSVVGDGNYLVKRRAFGQENTPSASVLDTSAPASPWEIRRMKSELVEAKAEITSLESRVSQLHGVRKEMELLFQQEKSSLQSSIDRDRSTIRELEMRVKTLKKREEKLRLDLSDTVSNANKEKVSLGQKIIELREENMTKAQKLAEVEGGSSEAVRDLALSKTELTSLRQELETSREQVEALTSQVVKFQKESRQFELERANFAAAQTKIVELEAELKSQAENAAFVKSQQNKIFRYGELEKQIQSLTQDNAKLRQSSSNTIYLESEVEELRARLKSLQEREKELGALKVESGIMKSVLEEYQSVVDQVLGRKGGIPAALSSYLRELHSSHLLATSQQTHLQVMLKALEDEKQSILNEKSLLHDEVARLKGELDQHNTKIRRLSNNYNLITWERNDLRRLVDSCQKEITITSGSLDPRVDALEKLVAGYRKRMEQIEHDPSLVGGEFQQQDRSKLTEMENLKKERDELAAKVEQLQYEIDHRALKGDFNTQEMKIVHLRMNPTSEALNKRTDDLEACQAECARLRERVKLLQEGKMSDITQTIENKLDHASTKELQELREQVNSQKLQNQRLKEAFKATGHEFREAILSLFGYRVHGLPNKLYKLSNIYSDSPEHHLLFKMKSNGRMELLETEFSSTLSELIELHLCQQDSIPLFLSSLTIDLFKRISHFSSSYTQQLQSTTLT